jgi:hypothetical protein
VWIESGGNSAHARIPKILYSDAIWQETHLNALEPCATHRTYVIIILLTPRLHLQYRAQPFYTVHILNEFESSRIRPAGQGTNGKLLPSLPEALHLGDSVRSLRTIDLRIIDVDDQEIDCIVAPGCGRDSANTADPGNFVTHLLEHHLLSRREFLSMHQAVGSAHLAQSERHSLPPSASSTSERSKSHRNQHPKEASIELHLPAGTPRIFAPQGKSRR